MCLTTLALIAAGTVSAGGMTALIVKKVGGRSAAEVSDAKTPAEPENARREDR
jgi:hypothetical protein